MKLSTQISCISTLVVLLFLMDATTVVAQSSAIGAKGGLTVGLQRWNSNDREPLFAYNAGLVYESFTEGNLSYIVDLGYHVKGSAIRSQFFNTITNVNETYTARDRFYNLSLMVGAKGTVNTNMNEGRIYYLLGARLDYTLNDEIETAENFSQYVNAINYGVTAGGGIEFDLSEKGRLFIEFQVSPDFSQQIYVQPGNYVANYNGSTVLVSLQEQRVINTVIELTVGYKLLRYGSYE